jgi:hypothetical protein
LANFGETDIWMEIDLQPTALGRLRQLVYKSPKIRLAVWSGAAKAPLARSGAPSPMLAAGFLISPLLVHTQDLLNYYGGKTVRPKACSIELDPGSEHFWRRQVRFRIYRVEKQAALKQSHLFPGA